VPSPVTEKVAVPESFGQAGARPSDTASPFAISYPPCQALVHFHDPFHDLFTHFAIVRYPSRLRERIHEVMVDESAFRLHGEFVQEPDGGILGKGNCPAKRH
jgi:hypothetical protein